MNKFILLISFILLATLTANELGSVGSIKIEATEKNAILTLNGIPIGTGSAELDELEPGSYTVVGKLQINDSIVIKRSQAVEVSPKKTTYVVIDMSNDAIGVKYNESTRPFIFSIGMAFPTVWKKNRTDAGFFPTAIWTFREKFSAEVCLAPLFFSTTGVSPEQESMVPTQFYAVSRLIFQRWSPQKAVAFGGGVTAGCVLLGSTQTVLDSIMYQNSWDDEGIPVTHTEVANDVYLGGPSLMFRLGSNRVGLRTTYDLMFGSDKVAHIIQMAFLLDI